MILVILPLKEEFDLFTSHLKYLGHNPNNTWMYSNECPVIDFLSLNMFCAVGGHGKVQYAISSQHIIHSIGLEYIDGLICAGAAGGLDDTTIGCVVLGSSTIEHDYKESFGIDKSFPVFKGSDSFINEILKVNTRSRVKIKLALCGVRCRGIASGDEDIITKKRAEEVFNQTSAIAVAWEGAGGARVARFNGIPYLEIRAITDHCDHANLDKFKANLPMAMNNLAEVICMWRTLGSSNNIV